MSQIIEQPPERQAGMRLEVTFAGGDTGEWEIVRCDTITGPMLAIARRLAVVEGGERGTEDAIWRLRGVTSYERYVNAGERAALVARQPDLGRQSATRAALIPISKSAAWWALPADQRRAIFEGDSKHIATGLRYLPAVARRLHHGRDLGEPFDFLTWFEYAPADAGAFEELVESLRKTREWQSVEREVDIRLAR
jgi:hypothetical protein